MVVDPTNVAARYSEDRTYQQTMVNRSGEENPSNEGRPEAGQTSETGPAVVNNVSAAALETARAVNAPEQTANENRANTVAEGESKGQNQKALVGRDAYQRSRLDLVV